MDDEVYDEGYPVTMKSFIPKKEEAANKKMLVNELHGLSLTGTLPFFFFFHSSTPFMFVRRITKFSTPVE